MPCEILPDEFCRGGQLLEVQSGGGAYIYVGLNVPAGTPIYTPIEGTLFKTEGRGTPFRGFGAQVSNAEMTTAVLIKGDVSYETMAYEQVDAGQQIAAVGDRGIEGLLGYNFVHTIMVTTPEGSVVDLELLQARFPDAFQRAVIEGKAVPGPLPTPSIYNYIYLTEPPR